MDKSGSNEHWRGLPANVVAAVIGGVLSGLILAGFASRIGSPERTQTESPGAAPTVGYSATPVALTGASGTSYATPPGQSATVQSEQPSSAPVDPVMTAIEIWTDLPQPVNSGKRVGENKFQLDDAGQLTMSYGWRSLDQNGSVINESKCQIVATLNGPQVLPSMLSDKCSQGIAGFFYHLDNQLDITSPGHYSVSVVDELSGVSASLEFEVVGR